MDTPEDQVKLTVYLPVKLFEWLKEDTAILNRQCQTDTPVATWATALLRWAIEDRRRLVSKEKTE